MKRFVELGGLLLLILGLGPIVAGADVLHSQTFRLLMLGTTLIVVGLDMLIMNGKAERSEVLFVGGTALLGLAAGPF
ncbi:MAG: hypothetical protein ACR2QJ_03195, partial [Geminicoccaceae bacterium]